jgi:hypothetical protein
MMGYTNDANVWDLSIVQGPFSAYPSQTLTLRFASFASRCGAARAQSDAGPVVVANTAAPRCTLLVCPSSVIGNWQTQAFEHIAEGAGLKIYT